MKSTKNFTLYHLSDKNHDGETFFPRVPTSYYRDEFDCPLEDTITPRVCFSKHINGAYLAINTDTDSVFMAGRYYVHVPMYDIMGNDIIKPTRKQCVDSAYTYERWVVKPVKMKCIGLACISCNKTKHDIRISWRPKVKIKWIEKYE